MSMTLLLLFSLLHVGRSQTFNSISRNFCAGISSGALPDNLSCPEEPIESGICILRSTLCDGITDCQDGGSGSDEGDDREFSSLECKCH